MTAAGDGGDEPRLVPGAVSTRGIDIGGTPETPAHTWDALPSILDGDGGEEECEDQWPLMYMSLLIGKPIAGVHVACF